MQSALAEPDPFNPRAGQALCLDDAVPVGQEPTARSQAPSPQGSDERTEIRTPHHDDDRGEASFTETLEINASPNTLAPHVALEHASREQQQRGLARAAGAIQRKELPGSTVSATSSTAWMTSPPL